MRPGTPGFVRHRLIEAREARAITALSLADVVGVTRAAISQYENGHQSPSPDVMRKLSIALNVPLHRFVTPVQPREGGTVFYRCMSAATKRARMRAQRRYEWLREACNYIERFVTFRPVTFPSFDLPSDPTKISLDRVEEIANETRRFYRLGNDPVGSMVGLLENQGAIVARCDLEAMTLDAFSEWVPSEPRPYIVLSSAKSCAVRSRFDAAHEFGHMILHRHVTKALLNQNNCFDLIEDQAHRFASAFLLPAEAFTDKLYAPSLDAFRSMKSHWRVAISAMIMRATDLRVINDEQAKKLWINLGRRKWRLREPLDDTLEIESPQYLRRCVELLLERRLIGPNDMMAQMGLPPADMEQLLGLRHGALAAEQMQIDISSDGPGIASAKNDEDPDIIPFRIAQ